jgi:hypothetical protein
MKLFFFAFVFGLSAQLSFSQVICTVKVTQSDQEIVREQSAGIGSGFYKLKPDVFEISVLPSSCEPSIFLLTSNEMVKKIFEKPLIYSGVGFGMAASEAESDIFIWTRPENSLLPAEIPTEGSFERKQYDALCAELKFCPTAHSAFSSYWPFKSDFIGSKKTAVFKRAHQTQPLSWLSGKKISVVIYTQWRSLPSQYPMANSTSYLYRPHLLQFDFSQN